MNLSHNSENLESQLRDPSYSLLVQNNIIQQRYIRRLLRSLVGLLIVGSIYLLDQRPESLSLDKALLALGITWTALFPSFQYLSDRNRPPMPFFPLVGLFYATSFGLPVFANDLMLTSSFKYINSTSLSLVLLGLCAMNVAFYFSKASLWKRVLPLSTPSSYSKNRLSALLWFFLLLHLFFLYSPFLTALPSVGQLLGPLGYIAFGMFYIIWKRGWSSPIQKILLTGIFIPMAIIPRFASGSLAPLMLFGLFMVIIIFYETKRLPFIFITFTLLFFIIFNPIKGEFRSLTWSGGRDSALNPIEKVQTFIDIAIKHYTGEENLNKQEVVNSASNSAIDRSAHIIVFSQVVNDTPERVPYWGGATYLPLLTSFIPRFIFPDKPVENTGNVFGRRYGYLGNKDSTTSFNLPWIVEMYANFGKLGVVLGMVLVGIFLSFLEQKLNRLEMQPLDFVTGVTILFRLIYQESNFSLMVGGVLTLYVTLYALFRFFLSPWKQHNY